MELFCEPFREAVLQAVRGSHTVVATVMSRPHPCTDRLKAAPGACSNG